MSQFDSEGLKDAEPNDILPAAIATGLSAKKPSISLKGEIGLDFDKNRGVDNTEDVDFYKFNLKADDKVVIDVDAMQLGSAFEGALQLFDAEGNGLIADIGESAALPGELFLSEYDPHLEYTAEQDGTYYLGVSSYPNYDPALLPDPSEEEEELAYYDPFTPGSGAGYTSGEYTVNISLNDAPLAGSTPDDTPDDTPDNTPDDTSGNGNGPTISLQTIAGTYGAEATGGALLAPAVVESVEEGAGVLTLSLSAEGEVPEDGVEVIIKSDTPVTDYYASGFKPFSPGGEVLEAVYDPETGEAIGIKFKMTAANAIINLPITDNGEPNDSQQIAFTLEAGEGYTVSPELNNSKVTIYDTLDQVPAPTVTPKVSFSVDNTELVESEGGSTTLTFNLSEPPPPKGTLVYVDSGVSGAISQFDVLNAEVTGGAFPAANFISSGFYFKITEQTASITLSAFADDVPEGIQSLNFELQPGAGYAVAPDASSVALNLADTPDSKVQVSYEFDPSVQTENEEGNIAYEPGNLVESEGTVSVHKFSLSAPPPEGGVTISVTASNLDDFDLSQIYVAGGEIVASREDGFDLNITDQNAVVTVPVSDDGEDEGSEEVSFTIEPGDDYQVSPTLSTATFNVYDIRDRLPIVDAESNDTISLAQNLNLGANKTSAAVEGSINDTFGQVDTSEDVDFYKFDFNADDTVKIDIDTEPYESEDYDVPQQLDSVLRLFDTEGKELLMVDNASAPGEPYGSTRDPYAEFTATADGTYYLGVSQLGNFTYDPFTQASGSAWVFPEQGINNGEYTMEINLIPGSSTV